MSYQCKCKLGNMFRIGSGGHRRSCSRIASADSEGKQVQQLVVVTAVSCIGFREEKLPIKPAEIVSQNYPSRGELEAAAVLRLCQRNHCATKGRVCPIRQRARAHTHAHTHAHVSLSTSFLVLNSFSAFAQKPRTLIS